MIDFTTDNPPRTTDERMLALSSIARIERQLGYLDERISETELPASRFDGKHYQAEVPDTLDLTDRARFAINAYTRMVDPAMDYRFCGNANFARQPPVVIIGGGHECTSKQLESLVLMRIMSGSSYNLDIDNKLMSSMLHMAGEDGFFYCPWSKVSWMPGYLSGAPVGHDVVSPTQQPFASVWEEERQVIALSMWYQHDANPLWTELIDRKLERLRELAAWREDYCYFARRFYVLPDKGSVEGPLPTGQWGLFDAMFGVHGMSLYHRLTGSEPALKLAGSLVRRVMRDRTAFGEDGRWLTHHFHTNTAALIGILDYATTVNDRELMEFARDSYEFGRAAGEPLVGYYAEHIPGMADADSHELPGSHATCETCEVADMLVLGLKLTLAGLGDYWEDVDRCLRNQFVENQILRTDWPERWGAGVDASDYRPGGEPLQLWEDQTDAVERAVGSWAGWAAANDGRHRSLMQCCAGNAGRSMYYAWDSILTREENEVKVNLLLNRASTWLDVDSHLPYEGKVELKIKVAPTVAVRIPDWVDRSQVSCGVNGRSRDLNWSDSYVRLAGLSPGDVVSVTFPMRERRLFTDIGGATYRLAIKGNTVIEIDPPGTVYPLYQRDHYRRNSAPLKTVERFVPCDSIRW